MFSTRVVTLKKILSLQHQIFRSQSENQNYDKVATVFPDHNLRGIIVLHVRLKKTSRIFPEKNNHMS